MSSQANQQSSLHWVKWCGPQHWEDRIAALIHSCSLLQSHMREWGNRNLIRSASPPEAHSSSLGTQSKSRERNWRHWYKLNLSDCRRLGITSSVTWSSVWRHVTAILKSHDSYTAVMWVSCCSHVTGMLKSHETNPNVQYYTIPPWFSECPSNTQSHWKPAPVLEGSYHSHQSQWVVPSGCVLEGSFCMLRERAHQYTQRSYWPETNTKEHENGVTRPNATWWGIFKG